MTIINQPLRPGAPAFARTGYRLDPSAPRPAGVLPAFPEAGIKGNLAIGRTGQSMIVDRVDVMGTGYAGAGVPNILALRCGRYDDTAGDDLYFSIQSAANESINTLWQIEKFGYVNEPSFSQPVAIPGGSNYREENNYLSFYTLNLAYPLAGVNDTGEIMLGLRYMDRDAAYRQGVKSGAWGSCAVLMSGVALGLPSYLNAAQLLAAPGAGKFHAIRTLCLSVASGGTTHYRYGIATSSVGTVTIAAGSTTTAINVTPGSLTASAHIGELLFILTGNRRGEVRQITANTTGQVTVGTAFTLAPAAADTAVILNPLHEWYGSVAVNGFGQRTFLTDINWPTPENKALWFYSEGTSSGGAGAPTTDFDGRVSVTVGAESKDVAGHNFVNLTGAAQ